MPISLHRHLRDSPHYLKMLCTTQHNELDSHRQQLKASQHTYNAAVTTKTRLFWAWMH